jgi:hypothetical protein
MQTAKLIVFSSLAIASLGLVCARAMAESDWQKSYPLHGRPSLSLSAGDSSLEVRSCGNCSQALIRVQWNDRKSGDYILTESQSGNHVSFALKEKPNFGVHFHVVNYRNPQVIVDSPAAADVEARTADGSLNLSGIQGNLTLHTSDGSLDATDVSGVLRFNSSDGSIRVHNAAGSIESHSSDGYATIDGRFSAIEIQSSDGSIDLTLNQGSKLTAASRIKSSDGSIKILVPADFAAVVDLSVSDGHVDCKLPLTMDHYDSKQHIHGRLNGGQVPLEIHSSDGSVTLGRL